MTIFKFSIVFAISKILPKNKTFRNNSDPIELFQEIIISLFLWIPLFSPFSDRRQHGEGSLDSGGGWPPSSSASTTAPPAAAPSQGFTWKLLNRAQKRRHLEATRSAERASKRQRQELALSAAAALDQLAFLQHAAEQEEPELEVAADTRDTTQLVDVACSVHSTHYPLRFCGGFVLCLACLAMGSTDSSRHGLATECRGKRGRNSGAASRAKELQRGRHPRRQQATSWPDGSPLGRPALPGRLALYIYMLRSRPSGSAPAHVCHTSTATLTHCTHDVT